MKYLSATYVELLPIYHYLKCKTKDVIRNKMSRFILSAVNNISTMAMVAKKMTAIWTAPSLMYLALFRSLCQDAY